MSSIDLIELDGEENPALVKLNIYDMVSMYLKLKLHRIVKVNNSCISCLKLSWVVAYNRLYYYTSCYKFLLSMKLIHEDIFVRTTNG